MCRYGAHIFSGVYILGGNVLDEKVKMDKIDKMEEMGQMDKMERLTVERFLKRDKMEPGKRKRKRKWKRKPFG